MWRTLTDEAREAIGALCDEHGRHLYDYCRTALAGSDAELAVAGALLSAHAHAGRLPSPDALRPWLYALARAHRAAVAAARPASIGSWSRPGPAPDLVPEGLTALDGPHRELLDLSVRHELSDDEIALIFDADTGDVTAIVTEAADTLEQWFAAVRAARTRDGCARLASRLTDWARTPGRRNRTRIARHILTCPECQAAPRTLRAATLLRRLPLADTPGTLREQPAWGQPLPDDDTAWRPDGFPVQARGLAEPPPAMISLLPGPTTETRDNPWPATGAAVAGQEPLPAPTPPEPPEDDWAPPRPVPRAPVAEEGEGRGVRVVEEARVRRGGNGAGSGQALVHAAHPGSGQRREYYLPPDPVPPHDPLRARELARPAARPGERRRAEPGDKLVHAGDRPPPRDDGGDARWEDFWRERPDEDDPEARISLRWLVRTALIFGLVLLAGGLTWSVLKPQSRQAATTAAPAAAAQPPTAPQPTAQEPTAQETTGPEPTAQETTGPEPTAEEPLVQEPTLQDPPAREPTGAAEEPGTALPAPEPPVAKLTPASVRLGEKRSGRFRLTCTGDCRVTSFSGTNGITVDGNTFTVRAPAERPGCAGPPVTESGVITVGWSGTTTGDGRTTEGATAGDGTLTMIVSWTVTTNRGAFIPDTNGGGYWSNCPKGE
ncbi:hypothetical protein [Nonomuraea ceibae]|uniref:hypothetical protein n=1 Tax=Nonomuraea ceibae TaxID=1935170 RepID=UPI001C5E7BA6|nr:hypothetical protein [Nonomuraea ceibae]